MSGTAGQNKGSLILSRGGLADRPLSPEEWLDREVRSLFASWKANSGQGPYASRGVANVVHGINSPHRIIARRMREARETRVQHALVWALGRIWSEYADRLYGRRPDPDSPVALRAA